VDRTQIQRQKEEGKEGKNEAKVVKVVRDGRKE
jgi:hypothetical protein